MLLKRNNHLVCRCSMLLPILILLAEIFVPPIPAGAAGSPSTVIEQPKEFAVASRAGLLPGNLDSLSDSAEAIFNLAKAGKIDRTRKDLDRLKKIATGLGGNQSTENLILLPRLESTIADLDKAIVTKNRLETMRNANRITLIAATLAVPLIPAIPTELSFLDYNDRELAIWSEVNMPDKLSGIVIRMHLAWQTLMPKLIEHHGEKELKRFSDIMGRLELARTPEEYGRLSRQVLVETDIMRAIFAKPVTGVKPAGPSHPSDSIPHENHSY